MPDITASNVFIYDLFKDTVQRWDYNCIKW